MDDSRWERYAAAGGFVFVLLGAIGGFLPGTPPAPDDPVEIGTYFRDHAGAIQANQVMSGFALIGLAWWFGSLFRRMRAAEGGNPRLSVVAVLGLALGGSMAILSGAIASTAALRIDELGDSGAQLFYTLSAVTISSSAFGVVAFLAAVCALNLRAHMFPSWTNIVGWVASAAFLVGGFGAGSDSEALGMIGFMGFLVWSIWILAISVFMWRGTSVETAA